jgi:N-acetylmuramoyl-L-alanine amidase
MASLPPIQPPPIALPPAPSTPNAQRSKRTIIIDAGHGGIDPGTHGGTGLQEKEIVLAVAKRLREALEEAGRYKVTLTRDTDVFVPLRQRVLIARAARGDLFLSLHVDFNERHEIRGASIYTLSEEASDREAARLAEKENMSDIIAGVDLSAEEGPVASILIDLAQRDTMNRSARFAETTLAALPPATIVRAHPRKSAGFAVLKGPDIPAVLIELGYLSNAEDEAAMSTDAWRKRVARAIAHAIDQHFTREAPIAERQAAMP